MIDVSIIIVSMNKPEVLKTCLESILRHTHRVGYETFVVAYLYDSVQLSRLQQAYPWVKWIKSNEIRGFSENNNLALPEAVGRYCFVVNDDTYWNTDLIDSLTHRFDELKERHDKVAVLSPVIYKADGKTIQYCGRDRINAWQSILLYLNVWHDYKPGPYTHQQGVFLTYNICGAAFMIDRKLFEEQGWFDERFFFCPEDIALSTGLNEQGYSCWVDRELSIVHLEGMSGKTTSTTQTATIPAYIKGTCIYFAHGSVFRWWIITISFAIALLLNMNRHWLRSLTSPRPNADQILALGERNALRTLFRSTTPKEDFTRYYKLRL